MEFAEAINHASVPRQIPGKGGVRRVLCHDRAEDTRVLRQMKGLLLDEGPSEAGHRRWRPRGHAPLSRFASETQAQGSGPAPRQAGLQKHSQRQQVGPAGPGERARRESDDSLGLVIQDSTPAPGGRQGAREEGVDPAERRGQRSGSPRVLGPGDGTDKAKQERAEAEPRGARPSASTERSPAPRGARPGFSGPAGAERHVAAGAQGQRRGEPGDERVDSPEFVAIAACADPWAPWARGGEGRC